MCELKDFYSTEANRPHNGLIDLRCPWCNRKLRPTRAAWASCNVVYRKCPGAGCGASWSLDVSIVDGICVPVVIEWHREQRPYVRSAQ